MTDLDGGRCNVVVQMCLLPSTPVCGWEGATAQNGQVVL
jgi:hypothetical protein